MFVIVELELLGHKETITKRTPNISLSVDQNFKSHMKNKLLPDFRFSFPLCFVKPSGGFSVNASGCVLKEFHQECWEFLWWPKGNKRTTGSDERDMKNEEAINITQFYNVFNFPFNTKI